MNGPRNHAGRFRHYAFFAATAWTLIAASSLAWTYYQHKQEIIDVARSEARMAYNKDITYRLWNTRHGGVYVPVSSETKPNPYLSHIPERDITTPSGRRLTLVNPAYMVRQEHKLEKDRYGIIGHITSLKPLNPENAPDAWETRALKAFEKGEPEVVSVEAISGEEYMRFMRPLVTEEGCLRCHAAQGYKVGDIRGGLSLSVPMKPLWITTKSHIISNWIGHGLLWTLGVTLIFWGMKKLSDKTSMITASEFRYRMLFNNSNDAVFVHGYSVGKPGNFIEVNDVACRRLGYTRDELLNLSPADIDDPASRANIPEIAKKLADGGSMLFEAVHVAKDGTKIPVEINAHLFEIEGKPTVLSIARDISERKRSEEKLQAEKDKLKGILDSMPDGVYIVNQQYDVEYVNPAIEKDFGAVEGRKCYEYLHDRTEACPWCKNLEVFSGRSVRWEFFASKVGKTFDLFDTPIANADGSVSKLEFFHDITEHKKAEQEQQRLQSQLLQSQKMESIGRLAGGVAHDFNNILTAIIGYSELTLMALPEDSRFKEPIKTVKEAGERAAALTHQLLAFSRKQVLEIKAVDLNDIVVNTSKMLDRIIGEDITLEVHTRACSSKVMADRIQIGQVLMNLAVNARDAMPAGGRLTIETADAEVDEEAACSYYGIRAGRYATMSVTDTGVGMTREVQEKIFEPFFTMKEEGKGTGLGLAMVYGIIKQHGGHISVYSEPGRGTTFKIYLTAVTEDVPEEKEKKTTAMPHGNETVLVVDDESSIRMLVADVFGPLGYTVLSAAGGEEALKVCETFEGKIDLLLTDAVMPGISGMELADKFRAARPAAKIILMSGYPGDTIPERDISSLAAFFIEKPLTPAVLAKSIRDVLDGHTERD